MQLPKKFEWQSTYHHTDRQPFGCYVFDSVLAESMPKGYQVTSKTFLQLDSAYSSRRIGVLMVVDEQDLMKLDIEHLCNIAKRGGKVMIAASHSEEQPACDTAPYNELERKFGVKQNIISLIIESIIGLQEMSLNIKIRLLGVESQRCILTMIISFGRDW